MKTGALAVLFLLALAWRAEAETRNLALIESPGAEPSRAIEAAAPPQLAAPANPPPASAPRGNPLWAIPMLALQATRDRPLFSPSRRPPPPVVVAAAISVKSPPPPPPRPADPERPSVALVGTIVGEMERIAIFLNPVSKQTSRVREGDQESGWLVKSVDARSAVLVKNGETVTLALPKRSDDISGAAIPGLPSRRMGPAP